MPVFDREIPKLENKKKGSPAKNVSFPRYWQSFNEGEMPGNTFDAKFGKKPAKNRHWRESDRMQ